MSSKCTSRNPLPTYISNQQCASTLTTSKVYSRISFTKQTQYVSRKYIKEGEKCLIDMFLENGHSKRLSKNLVIKYSNKENNKNNHKNNTENRDYKIQKKLP